MRDVSGDPSDATIQTPRSGLIVHPRHAANCKYNEIYKCQGPTTKCICDVDLYYLYFFFILTLAVISTVVLLARIACLARSIECEAETDDDRATTTAKRLHLLKRRGLLQRLTISGPPIIWGYAMILFGLPTSLFYPTVATIVYYSNPIKSCGFAMVVAALLPTDTFVIKTVAIGAATVWYYSAYGMSKRFCYRFASASFNDMYQAFSVAVSFGSPILSVCLGSIVLYHLAISPKRTVLHTMWTSAGVSASYIVFVVAGKIGLKMWCDIKWTPSVWYEHLFSLGVDTFTGICCLTPYVRLYIEGHLNANSAEGAAAAGVAEAISNEDPHELMKHAQATFLCVDADRITKEDMFDNKPNPRLGTLSRCVHLGNVDAFLSHSWHDDPEAKWNSLQRWREAFKRENKGVEPTFWIDKYCINQSNIKESLACLPIYLSGCKKLVVLCGETYLERLWCIVELFVFLEMKLDHDDFEVYLLDHNKDATVDAIRNFEVDKARCFTPEDTSKLMEVVDAGGAHAKEHIAQFVKGIFIGDFLEPFRHGRVSIESLTKYGRASIESLTR